MLFSVSTTGSDTGGGTPDSGGGVDAYQWKQNGIDITGETSWQYRPSVGDFDNGAIITATVSLTGDYPCTYTSSGITISFNSPPTASLTSNKLATSHTVCEFESITFTATNTTLVGAAGTVTYTFTSDSAGELYRGPNNTHTTSFTLDTVVTVTIESNSGCTDSAALTVLVPKMTAAGTISASNADLLLCGSVASPAALSADVSGTSSNCNGCRCSCNISVADQKHRSCNLG